MSERLLRATARFFGSSRNFTAWIVIILAWACVGPFLHFSNTWQLLVNTPTTLVELFAAIAIQHVANEVEKKQDTQQEMEIKLAEHVEDIVTRLEVLGEAQLGWIGHLHGRIARIEDAVVPEEPESSAT